MFYHLSRLLGKLQAKPVQSLVIAALVVVIVSVIVYRLAVWLRRRRTANKSWLMFVSDASGSVVKVLIGLVVVAAMALHLSFEAVEFERQRGGVTERNYRAVQTIWGRPHIQEELSAKLTYWTEHTYNKDGLEIDPEKLKATTQPVGFRKAEKEHTFKGNPIVSTDHEIALSLNYRRKGGAMYPGFDTACQFRYRLLNFSDRQLKAVLSFPLPARQGLVDDLAIMIDDQPYDRPLEISGDTVGWQIDMAPGDARGVTVSYRSRGLDYLRFDPGSGRELANYRVRMICEGIAPEELDYPIGCMTPTSIEQEDGATVLTWQLGRAVTRLGMGLIVPKPEQAGYHVARVLAAAPWGLVLLMGLVTVTYLTAGSKLRWAALLLLAVAYHLYYLLMAHIGDYRPGLTGAMVIAAISLTSLVTIVQLSFYRGLSRWAPVGVFLVFSIVYPLLRISEDAGLLTTCLYVVLLGYVVVLAATVGRRSRGGGGEGGLSGR